MRPDEVTSGGGVLVTGIKHIAIAVRNLDAALQEYEKVLGLGPLAVQRFEFDRARTSEAHFMLNGVEVQLCQSWDGDGRFARYIAERGAEGVHHICYTVEDIERALAGARARGARLKPCASCGVLGAHQHSEGWVAFLEDRVTGMEAEFMQVYKPGEGPETEKRSM